MKHFKKAPNLKTHIIWILGSITLLSGNITIENARAYTIQDEIDAAQNLQLQIPDFKQKDGWINLTEPIDRSLLQNKITLYFFISSNCASCFEFSQTWQQLTEEYSNQLVIIGVYESSHPTLETKDRILRLITRQALKFPIYWDKNGTVKRQLGIHALPAIALADQNHHEVLKLEGEDAIRNHLQDALAHVMEKAKAHEALLDEPLSWPWIDQPTFSESMLHFPTGIVADGEKIIIADTGHNRIVILNPEGEVLRIIGSGNANHTDGSFEAAEFARPQGLALFGQQLFIADTDNNAIRLVDLQASQVTTIIGSDKLKVPVDVAIRNNKLFVSNQGTNQIVVFNLSSKEIETVLGNGHAEATDGYAEKAGIHSPTGLDLNAKGDLYFLDAGLPAIRVADLGSGQVMTLYSADSLHNPKDMVMARETLYMVDASDNALKSMDLFSANMQTLWNNLKEPEGIAIWDNEAWITDTGNHQIVVYDILNKTHRVIQPRAAQKNLTVSNQPVALSSGKNILQFYFKPPQDHTFTDQSYIQFDIQPLKNMFVLNPKGQLHRLDRNSNLPIAYEAATNEKTVLNGAFRISYCNNKNQTDCSIKNVIIQQPIVFSDKIKENRAIEIQITS